MFEITGTLRRVAFASIFTSAFALALPALVLAQGGVTIVRAEFGLFSADGTLQAATTVPHRVDQGYGWRLTLRSNTPQLRVREELTLPAEPKTWGDPEPGLRQKISADGRTAITELTLPLLNGQIANGWAVAPGDPKGEYLLKVKVEGAPEQVFRFRVQ